MENYIQKYRVGNSSQTELLVLINNGIFTLYKQASIELSQIDECQDEILNEYESFQGYILIAQLSIFLTFFVLKAWLISLFIKGSNVFWNKISQHAYNSYPNIKTKCSERLINLLQAPEEEVISYNELKKQRKNEFAITYSQIGGYCWRLSIIFILTGLYLGIFYSMLLKSIKLVSDEKKTLLNSVSYMKFDLQRAENYSLFKLNDPEFIERFFLITIKDYEKYRKRVLNNNFESMRNGKLYDYLYDNVNGEGFLKYGLNSGGNWIIMQSYEINDYQTLLSYYENNLNIFTLFELAINDIIDKGDSKINRIYESTVIGMVSYIICSILVCSLFYFPYITRKSKKLLYFQSVFQLLVFNDTNQKLKSIVPK